VTGSEKAEGIVGFLAAFIDEMIFLVRSNLGSSNGRHHFVVLLMMVDMSIKKLREVQNHI